MVTLKQLEKENKRLKETQRKLDEIRRTNLRRMNLAKANKKLAREIKFGKQIRVGKEVSSVVKSSGKRAGKEIFKGGKIVFKGLQRYGKFLNEQEMKQKALNRKLKTVKKTKRRK